MAVPPKRKAKPAETPADRRADKKAGIREGSARDKKIDARSMKKK